MVKGSKTSVKINGFRVSVGSWSPDRNLGVPKAWQRDYGGLQWIEAEPSPARRLAQQLAAWYSPS
jgi:hypothetical protein